MSRKRSGRLSVAGLVVLLVSLVSGCATISPTRGSVAQQLQNGQAGSKKTPLEQRLGARESSSQAGAESALSGSGPTLGGKTLLAAPSRPTDRGPTLEVAVATLPLPLLPDAAPLPSIPEPALGNEVVGAPSPSATQIGSIRIALYDQPVPSTGSTTPSVPSPVAAALPVLPPAPFSSPPLTNASAPSRAQAGSSPSASSQPARAQQAVPGAAQSPSQRSGSTPKTSAASASAGPSRPGGTVSNAGEGGAGQPTGAAQAAAGDGQAPGQAAPRTVYARVGDDITIALEGEGWTFVGGHGEQWERGVQYESRTVDGGGTTFIFRAKALGTWMLGFQQQNASSGTVSNRSFDIHVLTSAEFAKTVAEKGKNGSGTSAAGKGQAGASPGGGLASAEWLYKEGRYSQALNAYEKAWQPNDPALNQTIASLAYRVGRYQDAKKYWQKNFDLTGTTYGRLATVGLVKAATALKDGPELRALYSYLHGLTGISIRSELLSAARFLYEAKDWETALHYLQEYLARYRGQNGTDVADYLLGEIYGGDTPMQNAQTALNYYRDVVANYPTSEYYERARSNIAYLNRYFFEIR